MLNWSMPISCIGIDATPSQNGDAIDDEIASSNQPTTDGGQDSQDKQCLRQRRASKLSALALLRRTRNAGMAILVEWETACPRPGRATLVTSRAYRRRKAAKA